MVSDYLYQGSPAQHQILQGAFLDSLAKQFIADSEVVTEEADQAFGDQIIQIRMAAERLGLQLNQYTEVLEHVPPPVDRCRVLRRKIVLLRRKGLGYSAISRLVGLGIGTVAATLRAARAHGDKCAQRIGSHRIGRREILNHGHLCYYEQCCSSMKARQLSEKSMLLSEVAMLSLLTAASMQYGEL